MDLVPGIDSEIDGNYTKIRNASAFFDFDGANAQYVGLVIKI
jgi:hypothetical protein